MPRFLAEKTCAGVRLPRYYFDGSNGAGARAVFAFAAFAGVGGEAAAFAFSAFGAFAPFPWCPICLSALARFSLAFAAFALAIWTGRAARAHSRAVIFVITGGYAGGVFAPISRADE